MKYLFSIITISITLLACNQKTDKTIQNEIEPTPIKQSFIEPIQANLDAHGGLDLWNSFSSLKFDRPGDNGSVKHVVDLNSRDEIFTNDTLYTVGYLGNKTWVLPDSIAFTNARFYKNLYFYFFALPFLSADDGVIRESLGSKKFNGKLYDLVKLTYGENVGDSPEDQYILYINAETKLLDMINYSVTYFDTSRGEQYSAIIYNEWQNVDGLLVPKSFSGYKWENDSIGDKRYHADFENIKFDKNPLDKSIFAIPDNAYSE